MERRRIEREYKVTKWTLQLRSSRLVDQGDKVGGFLMDFIDQREPPKNLESRVVYLFYNTCI